MKKPKKDEVKKPKVKTPPPGTDISPGVAEYPSEVQAFGEVLKMSGVDVEKVPATLDYCSQSDLKDLARLDQNLWDMGFQPTTP